MKLKHSFVVGGVRHVSFRETSEYSADGRTFPLLGGAPEVTGSENKSQAGKDLCLPPHFQMR